MDTTKRAFGSLGGRLVVLVPYLWLAAFFLVPFLIVLKISLSQTVIAQPPYVPLLDLSAGWAGVRDFVGGLSFGNFATLVSDDIYYLSYLKSLLVAFVSTAILLVIGYPRVYAWINILQRDGLLNQALRALRLVDEPLAWLSTDTAIYIGVVYSYLPFMVLPLYATLQKMDET